MQGPFAGERLSIDPADLAEIKACSEASPACSKRVQQALQVVAIRSNNLRMIEIFRDASDDMHPLHLHRHNYELTHRRQGDRGRDQGRGNARRITGTRV